MDIDTIEQTIKQLLHIASYHWNAIEVSEWESQLSRFINNVKESANENQYN